MIIKLITNSSAGKTNTFSAHFPWSSHWRIMSNMFATVVTILGFFSSLVSGQTELCPKGPNTIGDCGCDGQIWVADGCHEVFNNHFHWDFCVIIVSRDSTVTVPDQKEMMMLRDVSWSVEKMRRCWLTQDWEVPGNVFLMTTLLESFVLENSTQCAGVRVRMRIVLLETVSVMDSWESAMIVKKQSKDWIH